MVSIIKSSNLRLLWAIGVIALLVGSARATELPYLGEWSNGRGETLVVTEKTIQFADNKPVAYRDITKATDGESFHLQITAGGRVNAFPGKFLQVSCDGDKMRIASYASGSDLMQDKNMLSEVTWFREE